MDRYATLHSMDRKDKIRAVIRAAGMREWQVAEAMGMTKQSFSNRMSRNSFGEDDLRRIAEIIGARYVEGFEFPDGSKIGF